MRQLCFPQEVVLFYHFPCTFCLNKFQRSAHQPKEGLKVNDEFCSDPPTFFCGFCGRSVQLHCCSNALPFNLVHFPKGEYPGKLTQREIISEGELSEHLDCLSE